MYSHNPSHDTNKIALLNKLNFAIKHVRATLVLANNKYEDFTKSNGWSALSPHLSFKKLGGYIKHVVRNADGTETKTTFNNNYHIDLSADVTFGKNEGQPNMADNHWFFDSSLYYSNYEIRSSKIPFEIYDYRFKTLKNPDDKSSPMIEIDPLKDDKFNINNDLRELLLYNISSNLTRTGNCLSFTICILEYLWLHPDGINRIEIMCSPGFDHTFVIVNRSGSPTDPETWGDAWIIDGWYKNGIVFHAREYATKIEEIKEYCLENIKKLSDATGIVPEENPMVEKYSVNPVIIEVIPSENIYPVVDKFKAVSDYYQLNDFRYMPHGRTFKQIREIQTQHQDEMKSVFVDLGVFKQDDNNIQPTSIPNDIKSNFKNPRK